MNSFVRLPIAIVILFAVIAVTSGGLVMAARQSEPQSWAIFREPDGQSCERPCVFGIVPGQTSLSEAQQIMNDHPLTRDYIIEDSGSFRQVYSTPEFSMVVALILDEDQIVLWIEGQFFGLDFTIADVLLLFGTPRYIRFAKTAVGGYLSLRYEGEYFFTSEIVNNEFDPSGRFFLFSLNAPYAAETDGAFGQIGVNEYPVWHGFGSLLRYDYLPECRRWVGGTPQKCLP
jgi:hypothetical protein